MKNLSDMPLKAGVLLVATLFTTPVMATDVSCSHSNGCSAYYSNNGNGVLGWVINQEGSTGNSTFVEGSDLTMTVQPGNYQSAPNNETGVTTNPTGGTTVTPQTIFHIDNYLVSNGKLVVPAGVTATLLGAKDYSSIVDVWNASAQVEKGATLILDKSYAQQNNLSDLENKSSQSAIEVREGKVDTSADIIMRSAFSDGLNVQGENSVINASNHKIALEKDASWGSAFYVSGSSTNGNKQGVINADHLQINSDADYSRAIFFDDDSTVSLKNSTINMNTPTSSIVMMGDPGDMNLNLIDSVAQTKGTAIISFDAFGDAYDKKVGNKNFNINLNNSVLTGEKGLFASNGDMESRVVDVWRKEYQEDRNTDPLTPATVNIKAVNGSKLVGAVEILTDCMPDLVNHDVPNKVNMDLTDSSWTFNRSSELNNLVLNNSDVISQNSQGFNKLVVNGDLTGSGHFFLNTDLASEQGDELIVKGRAEGSHQVTVNNSKNEPKKEGGRLTLIETNGGSASFNLTNNDGKNYVDAGAFRYDFKKEGNNWVLVNSTLAMRHPRPGVPLAPVAANNGGRVLSDNSNSVLGYTQAASTYLQQQQTIMGQRQMALHREPKGRLNGLWIQGDYSRSTHDAQDVGNQASSTGFKMHTDGFQIGYDRALGNGYAGVLAGHGNSKIEYNGDYYDTDLTSNSFGLYGGWQNESGWFADTTYRYTQFKAKTHGDETRFHANSLSVQGGKAIPINPTWSVVPQAELTVSRLSSTTYSDAASLLHSRVGADLQADYTLVNGIRLQPLVGAYYLGDHRHGEVKINQYSFEVPNNGDRAALRVGMNAVLTPASHLNVNLQTEHGNHYRRPIVAELGYRYTW